MNDGERWLQNLRERTRALEVRNYRERAECSAKAGRHREAREFLDAAARLEAKPTARPGIAAPASAPPAAGCSCAPGMWCTEAEFDRVYAAFLERRKAEREAQVQSMADAFMRAAKETAGWTIVERG
jgi:hypothetical protein